MGWLFAVHVALMLSELYDKWVTDAEPLSWGSRVETQTFRESGWGWSRTGKDSRERFSDGEGGVGWCCAGEVSCSVVGCVEGMNVKRELGL